MLYQEIVGSIHSARQKLTIKKSNLHYTRDITPKHVTSGGIRLRGLAPGQHSSEETSQRWRAVDYTGSDLTSQGMERQTSSADNDVYVNRLVRNTTDRLYFVYITWHVAHLRLP